jgi:16S rRNA (uracil1498-N3)-methyltransferase
MDRAVEVDEIALDPAGSHRVARVLRTKAGDAVEIIDGTGRRVVCGVARVEAGVVTLTIREVSTTSAAQSPTVEIQVVVSAPKGPRWDWLLQKCTELGASRVSPIYAARTQWKVPDVKTSGRLERWARIAGDAARQCGRDSAPSIDVPIALVAFLSALGPAGPSELRLVAVTGGEGRVGLAEAFASSDAPASMLRVLVGPEGGLTPREVELSLGAGFVPVTLGTRILRVETAAAMLVALGQYELGDMA